MAPERKVERSLSMRCSRCGAVIPSNEGMCLACGSVVQKADDAGLPAGSVIAGKYELLEQIGAGGMGRVYRAMQRSLRTEVCVKTLHRGATADPQFEARFEQEARTMSAIRHPNIVSILDFGTHVDGSMYIVMEYIAGQSLADLVKGGHLVSASRAVRLLGQVCDALSAAHDKGVIHRDLKPANIMVYDLPEKPDFVKVLDFGSALILEGAEGEAQRLTRVGTVIGTPAFMAPEHILGRGLDARVDVYAVGVLLYMLLTGSPPFRGKAQAVFAQQVSVQPELPSRRNPKADVSPAMERVIMRTLTKDPARRYRTAAELKAAMEAALAGILDDSVDLGEPSEAGPGVEIAPEDRSVVVATVRGTYGLAETMIEKIREAAAPYGAVVEADKSTVTLLFGLDRKGPEIATDAMECVLELASMETKRPLRVGVHDAQVSCRGWAGEPGFSYELFGDGRGLAEALASVAAPGQVLIAGPVARHVPTTLRLTPVLPPAHVSEPVFDLIDPSAAESRAARLPFVGRAEEQRALVEVAVDAKRGRVCVVEGPEGIGKSRLVNEVGSQAGRVGTFWCVVSASPRAEIGPSHPVSMVAALGWSSPSTGAASTTERYIVDLMLGRPERKLDGMSGERRQLRLVAASLEGLGKRLQQGPAVIVLDELQRADDLTWALARRLVDTAQLLQVSVVLCARDAAEIPFLLPSEVTRIRLGPLSEGECRKLTAAALTDADEATVDLLSSKTGGVPLLAEEVYRTVARGHGSLLMSLAGLEATEAVDRLVSSRIETLSEKALEVLCAAAVLGVEPGHAELMEVVEESHETMAALVELQSSGLLLRSPARRLQFPFGRVRDAALAAVPRAAVRGLHAKVAKTIMASDWADNRRFEIGEHLLAAAEWEAAFTELRRAGSLARADGETRRAARCLKQCVEAGAELGPERAPERVAVARDYGELLIQLGRLEEAEQLLREAFSEAREANVAEVGADLLRLHGRVAMLTGDVERGRQEIEATLTFAEKHGVRHVAAKACGDLADVHERRDDREGAAEALRRGLALVEGRTDEEVGSVRIQLWNRLGRLELQAGRLTGAIALFAQALDLAEKLEDQYQAAGLLGNLGGAYARQKDAAKALHFTERALRASEALGDQIGVARQSFNLALLRLQSGQSSAARQLLRGSYEAAKRSGWREGIAMSKTAMKKLGESPE